jgi:hypothetical protein
MMNVSDKGRCNMPVNYGASISSGILERGRLHATYQNPAQSILARVLLKRSDSVLAVPYYYDCCCTVLLGSTTLSAEE